MSIRKMPPSDSDSEKSYYYYPEDFRDREPPDKRWTILEFYSFRNMSLLSGGAVVKITTFLHSPRKFLAKLNLKYFR